MREFFNESGKINILITVSIILLTGFGLYLFSISKKLREIEKDRNANSFGK